MGLLQSCEGNIQIKAIKKLVYQKQSQNIYNLNWNCTYYKKMKPSETKDLYERLGVSRDATDDEIKSSFRQQARKYHPDRNKGSKEAENEFIAVFKAYEILSNPSARRSYDGFSNYWSDREGEQFNFTDWMIKAFTIPMTYQTIIEMFQKSYFWSVNPYLSPEFNERLTKIRKDLDNAFEKKEEKKERTVEDIVIDLFKKKND